jgi:hypothetical protein
MTPIADLGEKPSGRGLDVYVHHPRTSGRVAPTRLSPKRTCHGPVREPVAAEGLYAGTVNPSKIRGCVHLPPITHNLVKRQNVRESRYTRELPITPAVREILGRRWQAGLVMTPDGPKVCDLVFHRDGQPIVDFRDPWAKA